MRQGPRTSTGASDLRGWMLTDAGGCRAADFKSADRAFSQILQGDDLAVPVAGLAEEGGGVLVGGDGLLEPPHLLQGQAEVGQRHAFAVPVAGLADSHESGSFARSTASLSAGAANRNPLLRGGGRSNLTCAVPLDARPLWLRLMLDALAHAVGAERGLRRDTRPCKPRKKKGG